MAIDFGPIQFKAVRDYILEGKNHKDGSKPSRTYVNSIMRRIRRMFRWASGEGLLPPSVHLSLADVQPLRAGRTTARETERLHMPNGEFNLMPIEHRHETLFQIVLGADCRAFAKTACPSCPLGGCFWHLISKMLLDYVENYVIYYAISIGHRMMRFPNSLTSKGLREGNSQLRTEP